MTILSNLIDKKLKSKKVLIASYCLGSSVLSDVTDSLFEDLDMENPMKGSGSKKKKKKGPKAQMTNEEKMRGSKVSETSNINELTRSPDKGGEEDHYPVNPFILRADIRDESFSDLDMAIEVMDKKKKQEEEYENVNENDIDELDFI